VKSNALYRTMLLPPSVLILLSINWQRKYAAGT